MSFCLEIFRQFSLFWARSWNVLRSGPLHNRIKMDKLSRSDKQMEGTWKYLQLSHTDYYAILNALTNRVESLQVYWAFATLSSSLRGAYSHTYVVVVVVVITRSS